MNERKIETVLKNNSQKMDLHPLTLSFREKSYEFKFLNFYYDLSINLVRNALLLGLFFYSSFALLDYYLVPDLMYTFWLLRFSLVAPTVLITYVLSFTKIFKNNFQLMLACVVTIAGINISLMILIATGTASYTYYAGLMLVLIYNYTISKLRFLWASVVGLLIILSYEIISISLLKTESIIFINNNFFLLGANLLGMLASYMMEYTTRKNFFLVELLEFEQQKVKDINAELEEKVEDRTKEISIALKNLQNEVEIRKSTEKRELEYKNDLELISNAALDFVRLSPQADLYAFITKKLYGLTGFDPISISSYDNEKKVITVKNIHFTEGIFAKIKKVIGFDPKKISSKLNKENIEILRTGKLHELTNGIEGFSIKAISKPIIDLVTKLLKINSVYTIGITSSGKLYGDISIILRDGKTLGNRKNLIELYAQLASIAIQRNMAIQDLRISEEKNTMVVTNLGEGIGIVNNKEEFIYVNSAAEAIFGVKPGTLVTRNLLEFVKPESFDEIAKITNNKLKDGLLSTYDLEIIRPNGEIRFITVTSSLLPNLNSEDIEVLGIFRDNTERIKAEMEIRKNLRDKDILLKEVFHRVKNNLQIITSILRMQAQYSEDGIVKAKLQKSVDRIHSMALIQSRIFHSGDFENINFPSYVSSIAANLLSTNNIYPGKIKIDYNIEDLQMNINMATPCGMLFSEIISNSIQHAFPGEMKGKIDISLSFKNDQFNLVICDDGVGFSEGIDIHSNTSMGFILINTLVSQLNGKIEIIPTKGTKIKITFNKQQLKTFSKIK